MLAGLTPEERAWLARKARALGGLEPALRFLVRQGLLCYVVVQRWESEQGGAAARGRRRGRRAKR